MCTLTHAVTVFIVQRPEACIMLDADKNWKSQLSCWLFT